MAKQTLEGWLTEVMNDEERGPCTALTLVQKIGQSDDDVYGIKLGDQKHDVKKLAQIFDHKASVRVQEEPGSHLFYVYAFHNTVQPSDKFPIRKNSVAELGGGATEEPTERGERAQRMRHNEGGIQFALKHTVTIFEQMLEMNRDLIRDNQMKAAENADAIRLTKEILMMHVANQQEFEMKRLAFMQNMRREEMLMKNIPSLVNTITGKEVYPVEAQDTAIIEMMLEGMTETQVKMFIAGQKSPEAQAILAARAAKFYAERKQAQEIAAQASPPELEDSGNKAAE